MFRSIFLHQYNHSQPLIRIIGIVLGIDWISSFAASAQRQQSYKPSLTYLAMSHMEGSASSVGHRGSLAFPTQMSQHHHASSSQQWDPRYNRNRSLSGNSFYAPTPHPKPGPWLNNLCHEPQGDMGTCCLGFWLPCALYGNTQYRLKQMAQGDDPLDLSEHDSCNGPCWMYQMLTCCFKIDCECRKIETR